MQGRAVMHRVLGRVQARQPQGRGRKRKGGGSQQHAPGGVALNGSTEITDALSVPKRKRNRLWLRRRDEKSTKRGVARDPPTI